MTNYEWATKGRPRRLAKYMLWTAAIMFIYTVVSGIGIYIVVMTSYSQNYQALTDAGFHDVILAPELVGERLLVILTLMPVIGIGIISPMVLKAVMETHRYQDEVEYIHSYPNEAKSEYDATVVKLHKHHLKMARK